MIDVIKVIFLCLHSFYCSLEFSVYLPFYISQIAKSLCEKIIHTYEIYFILMITMVLPTY